MTLTKGLLETVEESSYFIAKPEWNKDTTFGISFGGIRELDGYQELGWSHFEQFYNIPRKNAYDAIKEFFSKGKLIPSENQLWQILDLFQTYYALEQVYEIFVMGNSHYASSMDLSLKDENKAVETLKLLFDVVNKICRIFMLDQLILTPEMIHQIKFNTKPTLLIKNPDYPTKSKIEYLVSFISPYDTKTYTKDQVTKEMYKYL